MFGTPTNCNGPPCPGPLQYGGCRDFVPAGDMHQPGDLATPDPASQHGGCPVLAGEKLIATRWIQASQFA